MLEKLVEQGNFALGRDLVNRAAAVTADRACAKEVAIGAQSESPGRLAGVISRLPLEGVESSELAGGRDPKERSIASVTVPGTIRCAVEVSVRA